MHGFRALGECVRSASSLCAVALLALAATAPGCRCEGGSIGDPCDASDECNSGLVCDPITSTCQAMPGTDAGTDTGTGPEDSAVDGGGGPSDAADTDSGPIVTDTGPGTTCGNGIQEPGEICDDGNMSNDDFCRNDCTSTCGDGAVNAVELCDTAIAAGMPGACPTSCDDGIACTADSLSGSECLTECIAGPITAFVDGDGCCPGAGTNNDDTDCPITCGNGAIEMGEICDPPGTCPASCDDANDCTTDVMSGSAATCDASCSNTAIMVCVDADSCCPMGCTSGTDGDCSAGCDNGVIDPGETCDPIATCPVTCDDGLACTTDLLTGSAMTCNVACSNTPITTAMPGDGCCPPGATSCTDADCALACGNGCLEAGEGCDDGNTMSGDGCDATCVSEGPSPTAFRPSDLDLRDPHIYFSIPFFGCNDVTDSVPLMLAEPVNGQLQTAVQTDADMDGDLDLSFLAIFRPLDQSVPGTGAMDFAVGDCTDPLSTTVCDIAAGTTPEMTTFTNLDVGTCLGTIAGTTYGPYSPEVTAASATAGSACWSSAAITITLDLGGAMLTLYDAQIGARYIGAPATTMSNGLMRGFLTEADADVAMIDAGMGPVPMSSLLPGGTGNCASHSDVDMGPDGAGGMTTGWWFYLNFPATAVTYIGP